MKNIEHRMMRPACSPADVRRWADVLAIAIFLVSGALAVNGQQTNAPADPLDYNTYRLVTERNIFNQNRTGRYVRTTRQSRPRTTRAITESFSLVGTMSYPKGSFAFFDGTAAEYKKVLQPGSAIAGYTVKEITPQNVTLVGTNNVPMQMNIGTQMRREENGWQLSLQSQPPAAGSNDNTEAAAAPAETSGNSGMEMNDVLKKLMQQRAQEDSK